MPDTANTTIINQLTELLTEAQVAFERMDENTIVFGVREGDEPLQPLCARGHANSLALSLSVGSVPDQAALNRLAHFHGHVLAGAVFFSTYAAARGPQLALHTVAPLAPTARRAVALGQELDRMISRLQAAAEFYRSGELDELLCIGSVPDPESIRPQTDEGRQLLERLRLGLEEQGVHVQAERPSSRLLVRHPITGYTLRIETLGVLLKISLPLVDAPVRLDAPQLLAANDQRTDQGYSFYCLHDGPEGTDTVAACACVKVPHEQQTITRLLPLYEELSADVIGRVVSGQIGQIG